MGYELRRMIRDGAPAAWTTPERLVAMEIADDARDPDGSQDGWPWSAIPIEGYFYRDDEGKVQWRDGLIERTGMSARAVSRALTGLAAHGYEMREVIGQRKDGRAAVTAPGRAMRFLVPPLLPRPAHQRSPDSAIVDVDDRQERPSSGRNDRQIWHERSPNSATPLPQDPLTQDPLKDDAPAGVSDAQAALAFVDGTVTEAEAAAALRMLTENGARSAIAVLRSEIRKDRGEQLLKEARGRINGTSPGTVRRRRRLPWCGREGVCDKHTRFLLDEHGLPGAAPCPRCSPDRRRQLVTGTAP